MGTRHRTVSPKRSTPPASFLRRIAVRLLLGAFFFALIYGLQSGLSQHLLPQGARIQHPGSAYAATLEERLSSAVAAHPAVASTGVIVWDQASGRVIFERLADRVVAPASNMKLLIGIAALRELGPDFHLATRVMSNGVQSGDVLTGNVYVVGGGDPMLSTAAFARRNYRGMKVGTIESLAAQIRSRGITMIKGRLVMDEIMLDRRRWAPSWPVRFRYHQAPALSALSVNQSWLGGSRSGSSSKNPAKHTGKLLRAALLARGVKVTGPVVAAASPTYAPELAYVESPPMSDVVRHMMTTSDNFAAEILLKDIGRLTGGTGSTSYGAAAVKKSLRGLGVDTRRLRIHDGSGLSYYNRISPRQLSQAASAADKDPAIGRWLRKGLAVGGRTGTLKDRFTQSPYVGRIIAKTGTINVASALTGFATRPGGSSRYGFSVVTWNRGNLVSIVETRRLQDSVARILVR